MKYQAFKLSTVFCCCKYDGDEGLSAEMWHFWYRVQGLELLGQRTGAFLWLLIQNDKLLSRNFIPMYGPGSSTRERPPHSILLILNIFILQKTSLCYKVKGGHFLFSLICISWLQLWYVCLIGLLSFITPLFVNDLFHCLCHFSSEAVVFKIYLREFLMSHLLQIFSLWFVFKCCDYSWHPETTFS